MYQVIHRVLVSNQYIRGLNRLNRVSFCSLLTLFILLLSIVFPIVDHKDNVEATVTPSTTTLTLSTSNISTEITPNSTSGTFATSDPSTISVTTNNYSGYTLGIVSNNNTDNTKLVNTEDGTAYLNSISSASMANEFTANTWGYLPSKLNSIANAKYQPAPTTTATVIEATNAANSTANEYTIALGTKADYTLPSGTYENTFNIVATANPVNYSITYNKNTTDIVTDMPSNLSGDTPNTIITISDTVPQRTHYSFLGWCDVIPEDTSCAGNIYNPNGNGTNLSYDINQTTTNTGILYAMWEVTCNPNAASISNALCMQDMKSSVISSMTTNTTYQLIDKRDGKSYQIKKLADGRVWMVQNLAIDKGMTLTSETSDVISDYTIPETDLTEGDDYVTGRTHASGNTTTGNWYNFCAASAGTSCSQDKKEIATASVCPKGWHLPNYVEADSVTNYISNFPVGTQGSYKEGTIMEAGDSRWWSATPYPTYVYAQRSIRYTSSDQALHLYALYRAGGTFVRCVADYPLTISDIVYMQEFSALSSANLNSIKNSMTTNTAYQLGDMRDGTIYNIARLADNKIWLLDNLALDLTNSTVLEQMSYVDTNASSTSLYYLKNGGGTTSDKFATAGVISWASSYSYSAPLVNMNSKNTIPSNAPTNGKGNNKVGGYYNYCAVSAGSYCYGNGTDIGTSSGNATEDICPAGWRLPIGNTTGEYQALATAVIGDLPSGSAYYTDATKINTFRTVLSLPLSGVVRDTALTGSQGSGGWFWSSSRRSHQYMFALYTNGTNDLHTDNTNSRYLGASIRCIAK